MFKLPGKPLSEILADHTRPEYKELLTSGRKLTWSEFEKLRGNSYEFEQLYTILDDEALVAQTRRTLANCGAIKRGYPVQTTYDQSLVYTLVPLLLAALDRRVAADSAATRYNAPLESNGGQPV